MHFYADTRPLIDLSAQSSEAGDTPPAPTVLLPEVLSPTQLQLRSLSPAFGASMQQVKERDIEEIMQGTTTSGMPASLGAILAKRNDLGPLMYGRLSSADRSMSTVSYPDIYGGGSGESDEDVDNQYKLMQDTIYESEQEEEEQESSVNPAHIDTDADFDDEEEGDDMQFPMPDVQEEDIPYTSSPTHLASPGGPEVIDVLDSESRQATMDTAMPTGMAMPVPHTESSALEQAPLALTPPPSRITTMIQATNGAVDSPRDIFSPTPVAFPQPMNGLPFAFPFLREQLQQRLSSPPAASISQWNHNVVESTEKEDADERITEPTPYPSPPFTPPSSRPPTIYSSMALQIPPRDLAPEMLTTPDPFVVDRSPLSALAEESKPEMEVETALPVSHTVAEPDIKEPAVAVTEEHNETLYEPDSLTAEVEQVQSPPSYSEVAPSIFNEIIMPTARQGILRNPLSYVKQVENTPPRTISPVKSIGRGGLLNGSRIAVDEIPEESPVVATVESPVVSTVDADHTLVASAPEEPLNEVGTIIEQDPEYTGTEEHIHARQFSGANSGADDESTAPRAKTDLKKKKKKTKKTKKGVSFDEVPFVIGSDLEREEDGTDTVLNDVASPALSASPLPVAPIPIPRTFEIEEEEVVPELISPNVSNEAMLGSPIPFRSASLMSELMSPRSTADEMSDSSNTVLPPGQFSDKQVDQYGRWFARAHRDKAVSSISRLFPLFTDFFHFTAPNHSDLARSDEGMH